VAVLWRMVNGVRRSAGAWGKRANLVILFCGLVSLMINAHVNFDLYMIPALLFGAVLMMCWYLASEDILGECRFTCGVRDKKTWAVLIPLFVFIFVALPVWVVRAGIAVKDS